MILAKTRIRGQFVKPSTFHLSQHAATQREDTDLLPSRERARERAAPSTSSPSIPGVDTHATTAGDVSPPSVRFSNGQCISAGRGEIASSLSLSLSGAISRVGTREEKGRKTGSRRQRSGISLPIRWIDNARKARRKSCERGGKRVSITINRPCCRGSLDHYRPSLRDRKADLDAKSYISASYARETPCPHTARRFEC